MNNSNTNATGQLSLNFQRPAGTGPRRRPPTRMERAAWWFSRMHQTVDQARTWTTKPAATH